MSQEYYYALKDPRNNRVRYIGRTNNNIKRLAQHVSAKDRNSPEKNAWILELAQEKLQPIMDILEEHPIEPMERMNWREKKLILKHLQLGEPLLNIERLQKRVIAFLQSTPYDICMLWDTWLEKIEMSDNISRYRQKIKEEPTEENVKNLETYLDSIKSDIPRIQSLGCLYDVYISARYEDLCETRWPYRGASAHNNVLDRTPPWL